jgi:hypothetical protein
VGYVKAFIRGDFSSLKKAPGQVIQVLTIPARIESLLLCTSYLVLLPRALEIYLRAVLTRNYSVAEMKKLLILPPVTDDKSEYLRFLTFTIAKPEGKSLMHAFSAP